MIDEDYVFNDVVLNIDISNLLFKSIAVENIKYGHNEYRFTCSKNSIMYKWVKSAVDCKLIIINHKKPHVPSYNDEAYTFKYDIELTEKGVMYMEYLML